MQQAAAAIAGRCMLHGSGMHVMCCLEDRNLLNCHGKYAVAAQHPHDPQAVPGFSSLPMFPIEVSQLSQPKYGTSNHTLTVHCILTQKNRKYDRSVTQH